MKKRADIPSTLVPYLEVLLYVCYHISEVNVEKKSLANYLRPEYLAGVVGEKKEKYVEALSWAVEHPDYPYCELLPNIPFSNDDCVRLLGIFLSRIKALAQPNPE